MSAMPPQLSPMLCKSTKEIPDGLGWRMEPKFDGWRAVTLVTGDGVELYGGRNGSNYSGKVPYIEQALTECLPPGTAVDGELIAGGGWGSVQSVMTTNGAHKPTALSPGLSYVIFDVIQVRDRDLRQAPLGSRREILEMTTIEDQPFLALAPQGDASAKAHADFLELGLEGSVCKWVDSHYSSGRSGAWLKIKLVETLDVTVVGFKPGEGEFQGLLGALEVELPSGVRTHVSGMTLDERKDFTANFHELNGKIIEIEHNGVLRSGKVRHPRYMRTRDDKAPAPAPATPPKRPRAPRGGPWMRNYGAMGADKLLGCIRELEGGYGDAYDRCASKGGDVQVHIRAARDAAVAKGLTP